MEERTDKIMSVELELITPEQATLIYSKRQVQSIERQLRQFGYAQVEFLLPEVATQYEERGFHVATDPDNDFNCISTHPEIAEKMKNEIQLRTGKVQNQH